MVAARPASSLSPILWRQLWQQALYPRHVIADGVQRLGNNCCAPVPCTGQTTPEGLLEHRKTAIHRCSTASTHSKQLAWRLATTDCWEQAAACSTRFHGTVQASCRSLQSPTEHAVSAILNKQAAECRKPTLDKGQPLTS